MGVDFRLHKPLYQWKTVYGPPLTPRKSMYSDVILNAEVREWLDLHCIDYNTYTISDDDPDGHTYLYFHIVISSPNDAMFFKMTWL